MQRFLNKVINFINFNNCFLNIKIQFCDIIKIQNIELFLWLNKLQVVLIFLKLNQIINIIYLSQNNFFTITNY